MSSPPATAPPAAFDNLNSPPLGPTTAPPTTAPPTTAPPSSYAPNNPPSNTGPPPTYMYSSYGQDGAPPPAQYPPNAQAAPHPGHAAPQYVQPPPHPGWGPAGQLPQGGMQQPAVAGAGSYPMQGTYAPGTGSFPVGNPMVPVQQGDPHAAHALHASHQSMGSHPAGFHPQYGVSAPQPMAPPHGHPQPQMYSSGSAYSAQPGMSMQTSFMQSSAGGGLTTQQSVVSGVGPQAPLSNMPATEVKLEIAAKNLRDRDIISKSDPVAVVFEEVRNFHVPVGSPQEQQWREIGRTESIKDDLNPHFKIHVTVPYRFEELQNIRIGLWDIDSKNPALTNQDFLGDIRTTLGDVVAAGMWTGQLSYPRTQDNKKLLGGKRKLGSITVQVHENSKSEKIALRLSLSGIKLDKKDLFGKSDPYVIITQMKGRNASRTVLYTSEVIKKTLNPTWKPMRVLVDAPKGGTKADVRLEFQVVDKDERSRDDEIGLVVVTLDELEKSPALVLINSKNRARGKKRSAGTLRVDNCSSLVLPTMINYLQGGLRLHFTVAVDLTASNGDARNPASLHYMDPVSRSNQYVKALTAVGNIIQVYTPPDNRTAAFGFGADIDKSGIASHCFPLNFEGDPHCIGIEGILAAYGRTVSSVSLSGPTNFTPLLEAAIRLSQHRQHDQSNQNYDVVLILTDGVVSDFVRTIDKIVEASHSSALSIIIIGIGNADFKKMEVIDSDDRKLTGSNGQVAKRDIVQFVPYRDFMNGPPERLAAAVLAELPMQCVDYFTTLEPPVMPNPSMYSSAPPLSE